MAKFIIEVSDGYIQERADMDNIIKMYPESEKMPLALCDLVTFRVLCNELKNGSTEFYVNSSEVDGDLLKLLNDAVREIGLLYCAKVAKKANVCTDAATE